MTERAEEAETSVQVERRAGGEIASFLCLQDMKRKNISLVLSKFES